MGIVTDFMFKFGSDAKVSSRCLIFASCQILMEIVVLEEEQFNVKVYASFSL